MEEYSSDQAASELFSTTIRSLQPCELNGMPGARRAAEAGPAGVSTAHHQRPAAPDAPKLGLVPAVQLATISSTCSRWTCVLRYATLIRNLWSLSVSSKQIPRTAVKMSNAGLSIDGSFWKR